MASELKPSDKETGENGMKETEAMLPPPQKNTQGQKAANGASSKLWTTLLGGLAVLGLGFFGGWLGGISQHEGGDGIVQQRTVLTSEANVVSDIAKRLGESVVSVQVTSQSDDPVDLRDYYFGYGRGGMYQQSAGTGIILNSDGLILTNRHVVPPGTTEVSVTLSDGSVLEKVKVLGRTNSRDSLDIAFLKVEDKEGHTLKPARIGDSSAMKVGDPVVAIGNALGQFQNTVTSGIISGYGRSVQAADGSGASVENLDDLFQTDAAINEGNSGGPLVNINGEVIGINTAIASGSQNVGFAIPINNVKGLISSVQQTGRLERPYLGVIYIMLTDDLAKEYNLPVRRGAYIPAVSQLGDAGSAIVPGGPAEAADLKEGDIITKVNGRDINEKKSLVSLLSSHKPGDKVELSVLRDGKAISLSVKLGSAPAD